jgi:hypothetical protein
MRNETKARRPGRTLKVAVHARPGSLQPIRPRKITLTNRAHQVVWECRDLPPGAELLIAFREDPRGPFFHLEFAGSKVIGHGNRGPENTSRRYTYEARIRIDRARRSLGTAETDEAVGSLETVPIEADGEVRPLGEGTVLNEVTHPCDPPPGPPWEEESYLLTTDGEDEPQDQEG